MVLQAIRENEARTRAIGYPVQRYKIVAVMLSGCSLDWPACSTRSRTVSPRRLRFLSDLGRGRHLQRHGRHRHARGPDRRRCVLLAAARSVAFFTEYYLIPLGLIFIAMVIFMPQGLLGFMRRWLNR